MAATDLFRLSAWLFLLLIVLVWFARPEGRAAADQGAGGH
jgi:cbb3-type cytochrome oxidase subunit 3